jgi:copper chaperone
MKTVTYTVPNIMCQHCIHTIQTEVSDIQGVSSVQADEATKMVKIVFDAPATEDQLMKVLAEINYPVAA